MKKLIKKFLRRLRGEDVAIITQKSNKQIDKMAKAIEHLQEDVKEADQQAELHKIMVTNAERRSKQLQDQKARAAVVKRKLEHLFTATPEEVSEELFKKG